MPGFTQRLAEALSKPLPGIDSHRTMAPSCRGFRPFKHKYTAAVLIAFFQSGGKWRFPLIERVDDGYVHSGQIGFPGGKLEAGETPVETALREAEEEIGLNPALVEIAGQLSTISIPVSSFLVYPIVGRVNCLPQFTINPSEVQSVFTASVDSLLNPDIVDCEKRILSYGETDVPFFQMKGHKIWGATAMILSELKTVLDRIPLPRQP